jgi:hypothetical protein
MKAKTIIILDSLYKLGVATDAINRVDPSFGMKVVISKCQSKRTDAQNRLYWMWVGELALFTGDTKKGLHEFLKEEFIPTTYVKAFGKNIAKTKSTKDLKVKEFTELLREMEHWAWHFLQFRVSHPEDIYLNALCK